MIDQCVAMPGWGYYKTRSTSTDGNMVVTVTAAPCPANFFNPGRNTLPCRRCPGGLITDPAATAGATGTRHCLAAAGYLYDKLVAKPCPRGTWKATIDTSTRCNRCPMGLTTPQTASTSQDNCTQAMSGYQVVTPAVSAEPCPLNFYNPGGSSVSCIRCPQGLVTINTGARSVSSCMAPPGWGFNATDGTAAPCPLNFYKSGFNRRSCEPCGNGFLTQTTASDSKQRCYVPAGHGTISEAGVIRVVKCSRGLFGYASDIFGVTILPCRPCMEGMTTLDSNPVSGLPADALFTTPSSCVTWPGYGYERRAQAAKKCDVGSYSTGWSLEPCSSCGDGLTTVVSGVEAEGAASSSECVIAAGWYNDTGSNQPVPCDAGWYCPGLTSAAAAIPCPVGTTTSVAEAKSVGECNVCLGGYGSWIVSASGAPSCSLCPANTYGPQGSIEACRACSGDTVSKNGSDSQGDCYDRWQVLKKDFDYLPLGAGTTGTSVVAGRIYSEAQCRQACDTNAACVFYLFDRGMAGQSTGTCTLYLAAAGTAPVQMGMKVDEGIYSVVPVALSAYNIGDAVSSTVADWSNMGVSASLASGIKDAWLLATSDASIAVAACTRRCDQVEACVVALVHQVAASSFACGLRSGALGADQRTMYRISGSNIDRWFENTPWGAGAPVVIDNGAAVPPVSGPGLRVQSLPFYLAVPSGIAGTLVVAGATEASCASTCLADSTCALYSWAGNTCSLVINGTASPVRHEAYLKVAAGSYQFINAVQGQAQLGATISFSTPPADQVLQNWAFANFVDVKDYRVDAPWGNFPSGHVGIRGVTYTQAVAGCRDMCDGLPSCIMAFVSTVGNSNGNMFGCGLLGGPAATTQAYTGVKVP